MGLKWCFRCGPRTHNISFPGELVRDEHLGAQARIRNSRTGAQQWAFNKPFGWFWGKLKLERHQAGKEGGAWMCRRGREKLPLEVTICTSVDLSSHHCIPSTMLPATQGKLSTFLPNKWIRNINMESLCWRVWPQVLDNDMQDQQEFMISKWRWEINKKEKWDQLSHMDRYQNDNERQRCLEARRVRKLKSRQKSSIKASAFGYGANSIVH